MATEHFCLRWNNHQSTLVSVFDNLLESGTLVDCTLAADGRYLKAHKVVLSACSPYLGMLLSQHYDKHPIIILKDVKFDELKAMLDYMYRGEVNISQEQLSTFLKAAETLQIKGLTDAGSDEGNGIQPNRPPSSNSTTSANEDLQSPGPPGEGGSSPGPRKRKRNKHGDDGEGDSVSKISLSEGSDRLSGASVGSPSAKSASVKREPADGEGDGQMSVDDSGEVVMMSRPGPSNGGTNNKAPWILSADSSGEEMQLTPGQDGRSEWLGVRDRKDEKRVEDSGGDLQIEAEKIEHEIKQEIDPFQEEPDSLKEENELNSRPQSTGIVYTVMRTEDELIIPDQLDGSDLFHGGFQQNCYQPPAKSVFTNSHKDEYNLSRNERDGKNLQESTDSGHRLKEYRLVKGIPCSVKKPVKERSVEEEALRRVTTCLRNDGPETVDNTGLPKSRPSYASIQSMKDNSGTLKTSETSTLSRPTQLASLPKPSPSSAKFSENVYVEIVKSKTVGSGDIGDMRDKNKVCAKRTKLDVHLSKYRTILPATDSPCSSSTGPLHVPNVQTSMAEQQPTNPSQSQSSISTSVHQNSTTRHEQKQGSLMNSATLNSSTLSTPQEIQVAQMRTANTSLISIPQQLQGSQMINNANSVFSILPNNKSGQINNSNPTMLSIAPQFSISPIQTGNIQMQFSNGANLQTGNFHNAQFFSNANVSQNQMGSNQSNVLSQPAQAIAHTILVNSNGIGTCQTSNQFISSNPVNYNFTAPTSQPSFISSTSAPQSSMPSSSMQPPFYVRTPAGAYVRTPGVFVAGSTSEGLQSVNNTQSTKDGGTSPVIHVRGAHHPSQRYLLRPKMQQILPKK